MHIKTIVTIVLALVISLSSGYRILAIFPFNGKSHILILQQIAKSLAENGHQVDVISHFPLKEVVPNYTNIIHLGSGGDFPIDYKFVTSKEAKLDDLHQLMKEICGVLELPTLQNIIKNELVKPTYDLLMVHYLIGFQCLSAIGHIWNIPVAGVVTTSPYPMMNTFIENPMNLALYPSYLNSYNDKMSFWDRLHNVVTTYYDTYEAYKTVFDRQQDYINKYVGSDVPHYSYFEKTVTSLMLANSHHSIHGVKPKSPALIEIGGIHIKNDTTPIDKKLKNLLDQSKNGFIYFSFGTLLRIETFPVEMIEKFFEAIRKISPVQVIMRAPEPEALPKNQPKNLFIHRWLPQQQILQHENIKAFLTHGGVHGIQEAIYYAVPTICVPFFADQIMNCDLVNKKKLGLLLDYNAPQSVIDNAFQQILSNSLFIENVRNFSLLYKDRPRSPSEEATYWIEYVIRHGKNVLKSPAAHMKWWQIELLDVYAFIAACILLSSSILIILFRFLFVNLVSKKVYFIYCNENKFKEKKLN